MKTENIFNPKESIQAQKTYCAQKNLPVFTPYDGRCFCGCQIFAEGNISTKEASERLITRCPSCHRSFCE